MSRSKVILDGKGLALWMLYRGQDPAASEVGNTAPWGFRNFVEDILLSEILTNFNATDIVAVWDGGDDYRTSIYSRYKATRKARKAKMDPRQLENEKQVEEALKVFLANIGIVNVSCSGVEADDTIAAIANAYSDTNVVIYTGDADMLQLAVRPNVYVFLKDQVYKAGDKYQGVPMELIRFNKALCGDKSDDYLGVNRFGPKAWEKLAKEYGHDGMQEIEQCVATENYDDLRSAISATDDKLLKHIYENRHDAETAYDLADLHPELCYQFRGKTLVWPKYYVRLPNREKVMQVLNQMRCPDLMEKFEYLMPTETLVTPENWEEIRADILEHVANYQWLGWDYETVDPVQHAPFLEAIPKQQKTYVDVLSSEITGCSFNYGVDQQHTVYFPVNHRDTANLSADVLKEFLLELNDSGVRMVAHNAGFEDTVTQNTLGADLQNLYDTMIMSSYVNENDESGLKALTLQHFRYEQDTYKDTLAAAGAEDMSELTGEQVLHYGCDDSLVTSRLALLFELILRMESQWAFYTESELDPVKVIDDAFMTGVNLDYDEVSRLHKHAEEVITSGMARLREILAEHCTEPNPDAAKRLDKADGVYRIDVARYNAEKKGEKIKGDRALQMREQDKLKWAAAAVYTPFKETHIPPTFLGTATHLNLVLEGLGWELNEIKLEKNSNKAINEFLTQARQMPNFKDCEEFFDLLAAAVGPPLRNREGPEWDALAEFCLPHLGTGKIEKEGDELNLNSPDQMREILYCKLALPIRSRTKPQRNSARDKLGIPGSPATDDDAQKLAIAEDCEGPNEWKKEALKLMIEVKSQITKISLYFRTYPLWKHPRDGVTHPQIKNCGTVTRRPTGTNYNILQVEKGPTRACYLPRWNDHVIVATDFSGQELRITGSEAKDPLIIEAYTGGGVWTDEDGMVHPVTRDIHSVTAISFAETIFKRELGTADFEFTYDAFREWLNCDDPKLSAAANLARKMAKVVNFLIIYGGNEVTLAKDLGVATEFAKQLIDGVYATYLRIEPWQKETIKFGATYGHVRTAYGTVKHLTPDIRSKNGSVRSRQERQAVNQTIQGCAADILKKVLTTTHQTTLWKETQSHMIAPVYDEIVASVPVRNLFEYSERIQDAMNITPPGHAIPMMAEVCIGENWYAASQNELGDRPSERKLMECVDTFKDKLSA